MSIGSMLANPQYGRLPIGLSGGSPRARCSRRGSAECLLDRRREREEPTRGGGPSRRATTDGLPRWAAGGSLASVPQCARVGVASSFRSGGVATEELRPSGGG